MFSSCKVARNLSTLTSRLHHRHAFIRGLRSHSKVLAVQNFTMPAMSPTMTEGSITRWNVKEGETFTAGDVLLEIETDKAQMDVEAQDDGRMAKITHQAGSKDIKVGSRIAVLAETDDDLSSLSITAEESATTSPSPDTLKSAVHSLKSSDSQAEAPPSSKSEDASPMESSDAERPQRSVGKPQTQTYPLYPSIAQLFFEMGIPASEAHKIPASGPKGRLLKGDVLAYLGRIPPSYPSDQSKRISKLGALDLCEVKPAATQQIPILPPKETQARQAMESNHSDTEIAVPISLSSVVSVQNRIQTTLGVTLGLSTFIARATKLANDDLPRSVAANSTADELFNDILGLNGVYSKRSRGVYIPQITALPRKRHAESIIPPRQLNIYDTLTGTTSSKLSNSLEMPPLEFMAGSKPGDAINVLSVSVSKGEEKRARVFLERVKNILQIEPGKLVL